jgi:hypothetical protein
MRNPAIISLVILLLLSVACASGGGSADTGKVIKSAPVGNLTVTLSNKDGVLRHGDEEFTLSFKDAAGKPVEVGAASINFHMPAMGTMSAMSDAATLTTTNTPGVYRAKVKIEVAGEWQTQVTYDGPAGRGQTSFPVTAQ